jgi:hypothetical protein
MYNQEKKNTNSDKVRVCKICEEIKPIGAFYNYAYVTTNVCKVCKARVAEAPPENKTPSVIIPSEIDNTNTAKTWGEAMAFWGFKMNVTESVIGNGKCIVSMPKNWRVSHSAFSDVFILYDNLMRARARFCMLDKPPLLQILPAVSYEVDFDVHLQKRFSETPFYLQGQIKFRGAVVWRTPTMPAPVRTNSNGSETPESRDYRQQVREELTRQCQMYIKNHYPHAEKDAFAYWL